MSFTSLVLFVSGAATAAAFAPTGLSQFRHCKPLAAKQEATFGMGCFWAPAERLLKTDGVIDTVAGYTGNPEYTGKGPSYDSVCFSREWVEGVRVTYEDEKVSYEQLLDAFFEAQEPKVGSRQYASIIFPHTEEQEAAAKSWLGQSKVRSDGVSSALTSLEPLTPFYQAEGYHQRYWQKQRPRFAAIVALIAVSSGAVDSIVPVNMQSMLHTGANAAVLVASALQLLERKLDAKVVKL